ncbi:MAG: ThiF family adenylyltransferase [Candidatus Thermoplasmatota archaeon]|nr:ThiF family adenylyltransferase [Candidatus Thermoplasmatota archaeon]
MYAEIFQRNYGVFTSGEQERIKNARVIIIGCGEVGGNTGVTLARSGVEHLMLVDDDVFELSNTNRQTGSYVDTAGRKKVEVLREEIERINPEAEVSTMEERIAPEHLEQYLKGYDVLISSADDFAYSIVATRIAKRIGIPSVIGFPVGSLARIWTSTPGSPDIEDYFALPKNEPDYRALHEALYGAKGRLNYARWAQRRCSWSAEWASGYASSKLSLSQIAPVVWLTSSLVALEALKCITHKWEPVVFPRYWKITPTSADIKVFVSHSDKDEGDDEGGGELNAERALL